MKFGRLLPLIFLLSPMGCQFVHYEVENVVTAPIDAAQEFAFKTRLRHLARATWCRIPKEENVYYSPAFIKGFEDGFVDYVDAGGNGEPPAIPGWCLRHGLLNSNAGQEDIEDWYAGFRFGARVAREQGLRMLAIMPVSQPPLPPVEGIPARVNIPPAPTKTLPMPHPVIDDKK